MNMNEKPLVSVIVPVFKVEKYLKKCVESILNQTYKELEIILVDDGSPDECPKMCDAFSSIDERIRVIHKKNGGLSDARNAGIAVSTGEYLYCVDSDDLIKPEAIERSVQYAIKEDADIVITTREGNNKHDVIIDTGIGIFKTIFEKYYWEAWGKLIRRDLVDDLCYPVGKLYEDLGYVPYAILRASKVVIFDEGMYIYTIREDSIMGKSNLKLSPDLIEMFDKLVNFIRLEHSELYSFILYYSYRFLFHKRISINDICNSTNDAFRKKSRQFFYKNILSALSQKNISIKQKTELIKIVINSSIKRRYKIKGDL